MTVIAYTKGVMACDSCWATEGGTQEVSLTKIRRLKSGALLGCAGEGDSRDVELLLENVKSEKDLPLRSKLQELKLDWQGLLVLPDGKVFVVETSDAPDKKDAEIGIYPVNRGYAAVGTGKDIAFGAMAAGKSAAEAAKIACDWNIHCRPPIHTLNFVPPRRKKSKKG